MTSLNLKTKEWNLVRLGEVTEIQSGGTPSSSKIEYWENGTILWATLPDLRSKYLFNTIRKITELGLKKSSAKILPINTVIYSSRATLGEISIAKKETSTNQGSKNFICNSDKIFYEYLYYLLKSKKEEINTHATGATYKEINKTTFANLEVWLPSIDKQNEIAKFLSNYDDLIENNEKRINILESMAQKLYTEWFVKFKFPGHEKVKMIDSAHPDFGMIPEGWAIKKLIDMAFLVMGQSPTSDNYNKEKKGFPFHQGVADFGSLYPEDRIWSIGGNKFAESGDLLFSVRAPVGQMNIANKKIILGRGLSAVRHKENLQSLLCLMFMNKFTQKDMIGNGAIYKSVNKNELESLFFVTATKEIEIEFEKVAGLYFEEIANLSKQVKNLKKTRDILIPQLVGGKFLIEE